MKGPMQFFSTRHFWRPLKTIPIPIQNHYTTMVYNNTWQWSGPDDRSSDTGGLDRDETGVGGAMTDPARNGHDHPERAGGQTNGFQVRLAETHPMAHRVACIVLTMRLPTH